MWLLCDCFVLSYKTRGIAADPSRAFDLFTQLRCCRAFPFPTADESCSGWYGKWKLVSRAFICCINRYMIHPQSEMREVDDKIEARPNWSWHSTANPSREPLVNLSRAFDFVMWLPCDYYVITMWLLCDCYVIAMWLLCDCVVLSHQLLVAIVTSHVLLQVAIVRWLDSVPAA